MKFCTNFLSGSVELKIKGANFANLLNTITREEILVQNVSKIDDTTMLLKIRKNYLARLIAILNNKCYNYTITRKTGLFQNVGIGLVVGLVFCSIALAILSNFCFGVKINSDNVELVKKVEKVLSTHDFCVGKMWGSVNFEQIEATLRQEIEDLSLVNVTRNGAYLFVNFSSATLPITIEQENQQGIFSNVNGVISRVFVSKGTALVRPGDTVSVGQMLIAPYLLDANEEQVACSAKGAVFVYVWQSQTVEFSENSIEYARTGKTQVNQKVMFGNDILSSQENKISFETYQTEEKTKYLSNILPIKCIYTVFYETTPVTVTKKFADEETVLIYEAKQKALQSVSENEILEEKHTVSQIGEKYYITYYLKLEVQV